MELGLHNYETFSNVHVRPVPIFSRDYEGFATISNNVGVSESGLRGFYRRSPVSHLPQSTNARLEVSRLGGAYLSEFETPDLLIR